MAIDLASLSMPATEVPVLFNHDPNRIVGRATVVNDGRQLTVTQGRFSAVTDDGKQVAALMGEGHPWQLSVGLNGKTFDADRNKPMKLNGRTLAVDAVMRDGRLLEFSFVPSGADPKTYAARLSALAGNQQPEDQSMNELEQAQARIRELEATNATLTADLATRTTERDTANAALTAAAVASRNAAILGLFGEQHGLTDAQLTAYREMTDGQFDVVSATLRASRGADPALFTQAATGGRDHQGGGAAAEYHAPDGFAVDPAQAVLHTKALQYQAAHPGTDYLTAVRAAA